MAWERFIDIYPETSPDTLSDRSADHVPDDSPDDFPEDFSGDFRDAFSDAFPGDFPGDFPDAAEGTAADALSGDFAASGSQVPGPSARSLADSGSGSGSGSGSDSACVAAKGARVPSSLASAPGGPGLPAAGGERSGVGRAAGARTGGERTPGPRTAGPRTAGPPTAAPPTAGPSTAGRPVAGLLTTRQRTPGTRAVDAHAHPRRQSRAGLHGATAVGRPGGRDPFVDNARFLLVVLVVVGHNWAPVADAMRGVKAASLLVYAFHFPALVLLCGYLSRNFTGRPDQIRRLLTHVLVPYFVFEAAYAGVHTLMWEQPFTVSPTRPASVCWFLAALFVWRLTAPMWRAVRWPVVFAAALSVAAGLTDLGDELALPQMLMYWPWFVLGLRLRPAHLRPLRHSTARRWALPVMAAAAVGAWWVAPRVGREWLLMQVDNTELGMRPLQYVAVRLALFGIGAVLVAAFLALVPAHRTGYTVLGACALYPFLLHGLAVKAVEKAGGYDAVLTGGLLAVVGTTVLAIGLAALLGLPHVRQVLWPLVEPPFPGWLRGRGATGVRTGGGTPRHAVASDEVTTAPKTAASGVTSPSPTAGRAGTDGTPPAVGRAAAGPLQTRPTTLGRPGADGPPAADDRPGPDDRPDDRLGFQPRGGRPGRAANVG